NAHRLVQADGAVLGDVEIAAGLDDARLVGRGDRAAFALECELGVVGRVLLCFEPASRPGR
ncbi:hypothetical protein, partial [Bifidobacterium longum]|uniref:hypothetical protein n=1 Tax=Bifidobacterium longum TaxID=216816 RepID=UPI001F38EF0B